MQTMIPCLSVVDTVATVLVARVDSGRAYAAAGPAACGGRPPGTALTMEDLWGGRGCAAARPAAGTRSRTSPSAEPSAVRRHRG